MKMTAHDSTTTTTTISTELATPSLEKPTFFTVKYGENQSKIFNADCKNGILLHFIKTKCQCLKEDKIELSDEKGRVKNIRNNRRDYGTKFIKQRESVILLKVDPTIPDNDPKKTKYISTVKELQDNKAFMDAVNFGKIEEEARLRRKSSVTMAEHDDGHTSKSKTKTGTKKKPMNRRQSSRLMIKK